MACARNVTLNYLKERGGRLQGTNMKESVKLKEEDNIQEG